MTQQPRTPPTDDMDIAYQAGYEDGRTEARADLVAQIEKAVQREARNERSGVAAAALLRVVAIIRSAAAVEPSEW